MNSAVLRLQLHLVYIRKHICQWNFNLQPRDCEHHCAALSPPASSAKMPSSGADPPPTPPLLPFLDSHPPAHASRSSGHRARVSRCTVMAVSAQSAASLSAGAPHTHLRFGNESRMSAHVPQEILGRLAPSLYGRRSGQKTSAHSHAAAPPRSAPSPPHRSSRNPASRSSADTHSAALSSKVAITSPRVPQPRTPRSLDHIQSARLNWGHVLQPLRQAR